jgi:hypothetical protein
MPMRIVLNNFDDSDDRGDCFTLPVIAEYDTVTLIGRALRQTVRRRRGFAVVGEKGAGKTIALQTALDQFDERERRREALAGEYRRWRVLPLYTVRATSAWDFLKEVLEEVLATTPETHVKNRRRSEDELRADLRIHCAELRIAALAIDEAETLARPVLQALRDIISVAESRSLERFVTTPGGERHVQSAGLGILLVGTHELEKPLTRSKERGHRWAKIVKVPRVAPEQVAPILACWFPGFAQQIGTMGRTAWETFLKTDVCDGDNVSFRFLEHVAAEYFEAVTDNDPSIATRETTPFIRDIFVYAVSQARAASTDDDERGR